MTKTISNRLGCFRIDACKECWRFSGLKLHTARCDRSKWCAPNCWIQSKMTVVWEYVPVTFKRNYRDSVLHPLIQDRYSEVFCVTVYTNHENGFSLLKITYSTMVPVSKSLGRLMIDRLERIFFIYVYIYNFGHFWVHWCNLEPSWTNEGSRPRGDNLSNKMDWFPK